MAGILGKKVLWIFVSLLLALGAAGAAGAQEQEPYVPQGYAEAEDFLVQTVDPKCDTLYDFMDCTSTGRSADVVFVFDTTGSMGGEISAMKTASIAFANTLAASGLDYRLGLTEYKDFEKSTCGWTGDFPYKVYNGGNLTSNKTTFQGWVSGLSAKGGNDIPESLLAALAHTVTDQKWRGGSARKVAVVITDAPPHDDGNTCNAEGNTLSGVISKLVANGVVVHVVGPDNASVKKIAADTGGTWFEIRTTTNFATIIDKIADIIKCSFNISLNASCRGDRLFVEAQLIGAGGAILPDTGYLYLYDVDAKACKGGTCTNVPLSYNWSTKKWTGSIAASGTYEVGVTAKVCDWSSSASKTVSCDGGECDCRDCPDSDNDGVIDPWDLCPATPPCSGVDRHGCRVCEAGDCITLLKPVDGDVITTTLTFAAQACPVPAAVKFIMTWKPNPMAGTWVQGSWTDNNGADGWGLFNLPVTDIKLAPVKLKAQALDTGGKVICETPWVEFEFDTL